MDQDKTDQPKIIAHWLEGDGIGSNTTEDYNFLTTAAEKILQHLKQRLSEMGIDLEIKQHSLSSNTRLSLDEPEQVVQHHRDISDQIIDEGGFAIKFPGRTLKGEHIIFYLREMFPEDYPEFDNKTIKQVLTTDKGFDPDLATKKPFQAQVITGLCQQHPEYNAEQAMSVYRGWRSSPNALLREFLELQTIYRPLNQVSGGYVKPTLPTLDIFEPEDIDWSGNEDFEEISSGQYIRKIKETDLNRYTDELIAYAQSTGKPIVIASKNTISDFDNRFTEQVIAQAKKNGVEIREQLFDSFLELLARGKVEDEIIACLPMNAKMLKDLQEIKAEDIHEVNEEDIPNRHFFRVPIGAGYAEKAHKKDGYIAETYTLPQQEVKSSAQAAVKMALSQKDPEARTVVIVQATGKNPMDQQFSEWCIEVMQSLNCEYEVKTLGQVMADLIKNPTDKKCVFVGDNVTGDYASDFNAGNMLAGLPNGKSLGIPPSIDQAINDKGEITITLSNPAAGTAEALAVSPEASNNVLSASILKSIALGLTHHPFFSKDNAQAQEQVVAIGKLLSQAVDVVTSQHMDKTSHEKFAHDVIKTFENLSKN